MKSNHRSPATLNRRNFLTAGGAALAGGALLGGSSAATAESGARAAASTTIAHTAAGRVRGQHVQGVHIFRGIPYAAPTGGERRFLPPQPPAPWSDVRDAFQYGQQSPQLTAAMLAEEVISLDNSPQGEDCLSLNVWTAGVRDGRQRPVMVWFHGGGFSNGSGGDIRYDGSNLARKHDVVLVTVNERLNAFGFLYLADIGGAKYADSGNAGLLDLVAALRWVHDNIAEFGGDPGRVTIFGQSGGGGKTTTLMATPSAQGLFHRAIAESGMNLRGIEPEVASASTHRLMQRLGLAASQADELQRLPVNRILAAMSALSRGAGGAGGGLTFGPVIDGRTLPAAPFEPTAPHMSAGVPLLTGSTLTETTFMLATPRDPIDDGELHDLVKSNLHAGDADADRFIALYRRGFPAVDNMRLYQLISTDNWLTANIALLAERKAALGGAPVYVYHFEKTTPVEGGRLGAPHTLEIPYVFDNLDVPTSAIVTGSGADRYALAERMSSAWANFAHTGTPGAPGLPSWSPYSPEHRAVMVFNDQCELQIDPHSEQRIAMTQWHQQQSQRGA